MHLKAALSLGFIESRAGIGIGNGNGNGVGIGIGTEIGIGFQHVGFLCYRL